jgi:hypothetical protein
LSFEDIEKDFVITEADAVFIAEINAEYDAMQARQTAQQENEPTVIEIPSLEDPNLSALFQDAAHSVDLLRCPSPQPAYSFESRFNFSVQRYALAVRLSEAHHRWRA